MANASWIVIRPSRLVCLPLGPQPQSLEGFSTGSTMVNVSLANDHRIPLIAYHRNGHCVLHGAWLQRLVMSPVYIPLGPSIRYPHILLVMWRPKRGGRALVSSTGTSPVAGSFSFPTRTWRGQGRADHLNYLLCTRLHHT